MTDMRYDYAYIQAMTVDEWMTWISEQRRYWFEQGRNDAKFPYCACQIDVNDEDNFIPCALHEDWKKR